MTFLSVSLPFGLLAMFHGVLDSRFKLYTFCCQCTHQGGDWEIRWLVPWFDCDESLTCHGLKLNPGSFSCPIHIGLCGESHLLVSWCVDDRCDMAGSDKDWDRSRRHGAEDQGWSSTCRVLSGWMIGRSGDTVCSLYHPQWDEERGFLGWASKPRLADFLVEPQNQGRGVSWLSFKIKVGGFLGLDIKTGSCGLVI
jgi:hypothetical protein